MVALLLISIGILVVGIGGALVLAQRTGEARVAFLGLLLGLLGARQGIELSTVWGAPTSLAFDAAGLAEVAVLAAAAAGLAVLAALWRSLFERDRAESLHWNSMEAVRILSEVAARPTLTLDEKLDELLKIGCERFDLEVGLVSRVDGERYEVIGFRAPDDFPLPKDAVFLLADSHCTRALASERPIALEHIDSAASPQGDEHAGLGFRAYLGVAVRVFSEPIGTLCFASREPRKRRFTATDKDLLNLMSQWVGGELERRFAVEERKAFAEQQHEQAKVGRPAIRRHTASVARPVDVNAAVRRSEQNLRDRCGSGVELELGLADDLGEAARQPVAVGAIVESIVAQAVGALRGDGRMAVDTSNLEIVNRDPDLVPATAPAHYVTVSIRATGTGIEADSFANAFDPPADGSHRGSVWDLQHDLPLATIYRLLQRSGGDLSVEIEPSRCCTFTIFLPTFLPAADSQSSPQHAAPSVPVQPGA